MSEPSTRDLPAPLFQSQRQQEIVALAMQNARVEVAELARRFGVTTETIRRDLSELQRRRLLRRVHGGAVAWETSGFEPLLAVRKDQHDDEKRRLAVAAVDELPPSGTAIIDSGSTLTRFAEMIPAGRELRVVTNSLLTAQVLADKDGIDVVVLGGSVRKNTMAMVDSETIASVRPLAVDVLFISCDGLSPAAGLTTPYREEAALKRAMIGAARRVVALVDHSKFGLGHFIRFADWSDVDLLITNHEAEGRAVAEIEAFGTPVLRA